MKIFRYILLALVFSSCGTVVNYDYEKSADFTQYKTYNYFGDMETGLSGLDNKRIMRAIDAKLINMGMTLSENPDFYIDIQSQQIQNQNNNNVGVGVGGTGGNVGGGISVGLPMGGSKMTRELVVEFVDDSKTGVFWQAVSESNYNQNASPEKRQQYFDALIEKIFAGYPPKQ